MKKYLLVSFGYRKVAIPVESSAALASLIPAMADAKEVEQKGYGEDLRYIPTSDQVQFEIVNADIVTIGDEVATLKAELAEAKRSSEQYSKYWTSETGKSKELQKQLDELKAKHADAIT